MKNLILEDSVVKEKTDWDLKMSTVTQATVRSWPTPLTTTLSTTSTSSTLPATTTVDALLKLCLLWSVLNKPELSRRGEDSDIQDLQPTPVV